MLSTARGGGGDTLFRFSAVDSHGLGIGVIVPIPRPGCGPTAPSLSGGFARKDTSPDVKVHYFHISQIWTSAVHSLVTSFRQSADIGCIPTKDKASRGTGKQVSLWENP